MRTGSYPRLIALVESKVFTRIIILFIIAAAVLVGLETSDSMLSKHGKLIHFLDGFILYAFAAEALLKILSHLPKPTQYFKDGWNVFDFSIVVICFMPFDAEYVAVLRLASASCSQAIECRSKITDSRGGITTKYSFDVLRYHFTIHSLLYLCRFRSDAF